jgi:hypothetical protein
MFISYLTMATSWAEYNNELEASQGHHRQQSSQKNDVAELAATLLRPWNELHADPVYYHQLPTAGNTTELP